MLFNLGKLGKKEGQGPVNEEGADAPQSPESPVRTAGGSLAMDALREFLDDLKRLPSAKMHFLGLLHVLIGRRVTKADGTPVSAGMTWRELAAVLKKFRWDKETAGSLGLEVEDLPPRDRERYWYTVIARAHVDSAAAAEDGDRLAEIVRKKGYVVGPAPGAKA